MSPDKLFDYLDGRLSARERADLEEKLATDPHLQRELAIAREIHKGMRGSREVVGVNLDSSAQPAPSALGRKVATAFVVLVAVNVGIGLYFIVLGGKKNHDLGSNEAKVRQQLMKSLEKTAGDTLSVTHIGTNEVSITAPAGQREVVANKVIAAAERCGGSGTKGLPEENALSVFVEFPSDREMDFRRAIAPLNASGAALAPSSSVAASSGEKTRLQIRISESAPHGAK